jgi:chemotaxis protein methyltransferase CheR
LTGPNPTELAALRDVIRSAAGLIIDESRTDVLVSAVARRMRATGGSSAADYLDRLALDTAELHQLLELVVVRETYFGRIPPQIEALRRVILPEMIGRRAAERRLRVWSAGCSTGEEAWTLAMLLAQLLPAGWDARVIGTDLSGQALAVAEQGRYGSRAVAQLAAEDVQRWFTAGGETYEISSQLRPLVRFVRHNLVTDPSPLPAGERADLILCRNVTIYFDRATTRRAVDRFRDALAPDGWLMMGPSETLWRLHDGFEVVSFGEAFAYRRQEEQPPVRPARPAARRTARVEPVRRPLASIAARAGSGPARDLAAGQATGLAAGQAAPRVLVGEQSPIRAAAPEPAADHAVNAIRDHLLQGEYETAVAAAECLAVRDPMSTDAHYLHAVALVDLGRDRAALQPLRRAVYLSPRSPLPQFLLGTVLARLGHPAAARGAFAAAEYALRNCNDLDATVPELDGRRLGELAHLCRQLCAGEPMS